MGGALLAASRLGAMHGQDATGSPATATAGELAPRLSALAGGSAQDAADAFRKLFIIAAVFSSFAFLLALRVPDHRLDGPAKA